MHYIFSAGFVLFHKQDGKLRFLLLQYPGKYWDFAKGKIEKGETKQEAAIRELKEETGLTATMMPGFQEDLEYMFKQKGELYRKIVYYFIAEADQEEVILSPEHIAYAWLSYEDALAKLTYDNAKKILQKAYQFLS